MPWKIEERDGEYCVTQESDGEVAGCHNTVQEAKDQLSARYATEDEKATWTSTADLPDSCFLFVEPGEKKDGKTTPESLRHLPYKNKEGEIDLGHLRNAIARANQIKLKDGTLISESQANELKRKAQKILASQKEHDITMVQRIKDFISNLIEPEDSTFSVYKDSSGSWRFDGIYSNSFEDRDFDTLTGESHKVFSQLVEHGIVPYPLLLPWHVKSFPMGQADSIYYDEETKQAHVLGYWYESCYPYAENLSKERHLGMSHGMPRHLIDRQADNPSQIIRYVSTEVSVLPKNVAANLGTSFYVTKEMEEDMGLKPEQVKFLKDTVGLPEEYIEKLGEPMQAKESLDKEGEELAETPEQAKETETVKAEVQPEPEVKSTPDPAIDREELVTALTSLGSMVGNLGLTLKDLNDRVDSMETTMKQWDKAEEDRIAEKAADTPKASLQDLIMKSITGLGQDSARIDGRSTLAKGPKQAEVISSQTGVGLLDAMIAGKDWRQAMKGNVED